MHSTLPKDQQNFAVQAVAVGFHTHTHWRQVAGMFVAGQEAVVLVVAEVGCSPEECILVALTVDVVVGRIDFGRIVFGSEEVRLSGVHIGFGRMRSALGVVTSLEDKHWDCRCLGVEEVGGLASGHKDQALIAMVENRSLRCERKQDELIVGVLIEVGVSLGLGTGRQSLWQGIV
jgi:hypothetical protein